METNTDLNLENIAVQPKLPMKWYRCLVVFLCLGALINLGTAAEYIDGSLYLSNDITDAQIVYNYYGEELKILDVSCGILLFFLVVFNVYTSHQLYKYKENAPTCMLIIRIAQVAVPLLHSIGFLIITETPSFAEVFTAVLATAIIIPCEYRYFKRRKHLFIN